MKIYARTLYMLPILSAMLGGCGNGESSPTTNNAPPQPTPSAIKNSYTPAVAGFEANGEVPSLDRSSSLPGPDADNNGIRDDIDALLAFKTFSAPQLGAARQEARFVQAAITVDANNPQAVGSVKTLSINAANCLAMAFAGKETDYLKISKDLEKFTANTKPRIDAYLAYNKALNGTIDDLPGGNTCE